MSRNAEKYYFFEKTGWWRSRHHDHRKPLKNGRLGNAPERNIIKESDLYERDEKGVKRPMGKIARTEILVKGWERNEKKLQDENDSGENPLEETTKSAAHTISDAIVKFKNHRLPLLSKNTRPNYIRHLQHWEKRIGHLTLDKLDRETLFAERELLMTTPTVDGGGNPKERTNKTVNRYMATLSALYTACVRDYGWYDEHKMIPTSMLRPLPETAGRKREPLTQDEIERLFHAIQTMESESHLKGEKQHKVIGNPMLELAVYLAFITGARQHEIWALKQSQIDTENAKVTFTETKNGDDRVSGLIGRALDLLWEVQKTKGWSESEYVFPSPRDSSKTYDMRKPFKQALEIANIRNFHWHDLRHCVTSFLVEKGVPEATIMEIQGWKERDMVSYYNHNTKAVIEGQKQILDYLPAN